jgi:nuclear RNA export factor
MMPPRNSTPPIGSRHSSPSTRGASRGGIPKRRSGPAKIDKDGDLIMDAAGSTEKKPSGKGRPEGNRLGVRGSGRTSHGSGSSRGTLGSSQTQQAILRGLGLQQANILESRISNVSRGDSGAKVRRRDVEASDVQLCVHGMKQSKAASNPDGGLKDLLAFLERKAGGLESAPRRGVRIKKVCLTVKIMGSVTASEAIFPCMPE